LNRKEIQFLNKTIFFGMNKIQSKLTKKSPLPPLTVCQNKFIEATERLGYAPMGIKILASNRSDFDALFTDFYSLDETKEALEQA